MEKFFKTILNTFSGIRVNDVFDILLVAFVIYQVFMLLYETRAIQMLKGFIVILFFVVAAKLLELNTMTWILTGLGTIWIIAFIIVFHGCASVPSFESFPFVKSRNLTLDDTLAGTLKYSFALTKSLPVNGSE